MSEEEKDLQDKKELFTGKVYSQEEVNEIIKEYEKCIEELEGKLTQFENIIAGHAPEMPKEFMDELRKYYKFNRKFTF